jgi:hypothetical protein
MSYETRVSQLAARQIAGWGLPDSLLVDVYLYLTERLPLSPTSHLAAAPSLFAGEGMVCFFSVIDPGNRLRTYEVFFQVFYGADEETLHVRRGGFTLTSGL